MADFEPDISLQSKEVDSGEYLGMGGLIMEMLRVFLLAIVIIIPVRVFLFQPFFVQGSSMEPNFEDGEYLVISEFGYKHTRIGLDETWSFDVQPFKEIARQEAAVFHYPKNPDQYFIKRVIGLPGEEIEIRGGKVYIYNEEHPKGMILDESAYIGKAVLTEDMPRIRIGEASYFMMGDNRMYSYDSRSIGPIHKNQIIGRVLLRAWPTERLSVF